MFDCDTIFGPGIEDGMTLEIIEYLLIFIWDEALVDSDADDGRSDALGGGMGVMPCVSIEIAITAVKVFTCIPEIMAGKISLKNKIPN